MSDLNLFIQDFCSSSETSHSGKKKTHIVNMHWIYIANKIIHLDRTNTIHYHTQAQRTEAPRWRSL